MPPHRGGGGGGVVWSVILCSRSATRESQTDLRAAGRRAGEGWRRAERAEDWRWRGQAATRGDSTGRRIRLECVTLWKERQAAERSCLPSGTGVRAAYSRVTDGQGAEGAKSHVKRLARHPTDRRSSGRSPKMGICRWRRRRRRRGAGRCASRIHSDCQWHTG